MACRCALETAADRERLAPPVPSALAGVDCQSYVPPVGTPGNLKGKSVPYTCPLFSTQFASQYHTYKLVWTPGWIAWMVDTVVYRNTTNSPWRPVTMARARARLPGARGAWRGRASPA